MTRLPSLRNPREFRRVLNAGARGRSDGVTVFACPAESGRLGLVVPARVGGAVVRNRVKRRLRAIAGELPGLDRSDVVIRVEREAAAHSFQDLENHVTRALSAATPR